MCINTYCPLKISQHTAVILKIAGNKTEYTLNMSKLFPKCQYFVRVPLLSSTA